MHAVTERLAPPTVDFAAAPVERITLDDAVIPCRRFGAGPPLLLVHGFPTHGYTWRKILPRLAERFTCVAVDLPGLGDSEWTDRTDFGFLAHARRLKAVADRLGLDAYDVLAHDTGGTTARCLARSDAARVRRLVLINTEMPGHRPPWVREFQVAMRLPFALHTFRLLLQSRTYRRSGAGFGGCFADLDLLDGDFHRAFVAPCIGSMRRAEGLKRYLLGIDFAIVDAMAGWHGGMQLPVLLVWGEDDPTFPIGLARPMAGQFPDGRLVAVPRAKLLPHEERPEAVCDAILPFLS